MVQAIAQPQTITVEEFAQWKPAEGFYELHDGIIVKMPQPLGTQAEIASFLVEKVTVEYLRLGLPYRIPKTVLVKSPQSEFSLLAGSVGLKSSPSHQ